MRPSESLPLSLLHLLPPIPLTPFPIEPFQKLPQPAGAPPPPTPAPPPYWLCQRLPGPLTTFSPSCLVTSL